MAKKRSLCVINEHVEENIFDVVNVSWINKGALKGGWPNEYVPQVYGDINVPLQGIDSPWALALQF